MMQAIGIAVQKGNAVSVMGTVSKGQRLEEIGYGGVIRDKISVFNLYLPTYRSTSKHELSTFFYTFGYLTYIWQHLGFHRLAEKGIFKTSHFAVPIFPPTG